MRSVLVVRGSSKGSRGSFQIKTLVWLFDQSLVSEPDDEEDDEVWRLLRFCRIGVKSQKLYRR